MSIRPLLAFAAPCAIIAGAVVACAPVPPAYGPNVPPAAFSLADFGWSQAPGRGAIDGRIDFNLQGQRYDCTGPVALTPDTPYTRARFNTLYGSTNRAAIPETIVRARTVADPNAEYRSFVRPGRCEANRFRIGDLPDGSWFLIAPVRAGDETIVLMRRVQTRGNREIVVTL